jgi:hypothetical protein
MLEPIRMPIMIPTRNMIHCHSALDPNVALGVMTGLLFLLANPDFCPTIIHPTNMTEPSEFRHLILL